MGEAMSDVPLDAIDASESTLHRDDSWGRVFARFRWVEVVGDVRRQLNGFIRGISDVPALAHPHSTRRALA